MIENILMILILGALNIVCFFVGAKIGQKVVKGESVEMPSVNPIKAIREHNEKKSAEIEQDKLDKIMRNIERYDGTSKGQEDVG
jgi:uncharacterized protein YneF (UPF0154 family)